MQFTTSDIGLAIRDHIEEHDITHYDRRGEELVESAFKREIVFVDVSDPDNPVIHTANGQEFTCRVFAGDLTSPEVKRHEWMHDAHRAAVHRARKELVFDLWDFIENVTNDDPDRTSKFFALRERVRAMQD